MESILRLTNYFEGWQLSTSLNCDSKVTTNLDHPLNRALPENIPVKNTPTTRR